MTTTTSVRAFITVGARNVPHGDLSFNGHTVELVNHPDRPCIARVVGTTFNFGVTVDGLSIGLVEEHVEPNGRITITPSENGCGFRWTVIDIDGDDGGNSQVWLDAEGVGEFLADMAIAHLLPVRPRALDRDTEQFLRPHGGGAL